MHCEKCGFENPEGMRFCGQCATPLKRTCPSCGFANPFDFEFCGQCATRLDPAAEALPTSAVTPTQQNAERRQLTVLFCDIIGSSALSERIDPEELRDIMRDYRNTCNEIVSRYDGYVAQYLGDGVLVYFGYPHAHEDDAQRAALAALEIIKRIPQHVYPVQQGVDVQLAVRVGINTGLVVVGELGGGDKRSMALGETPNIAARLQEIATPNTVVVSQSTHQLLGERFACQSLGTHTLKGFSHAFELFQVQQAQRKRSKQNEQPTHAGLIGREQETSLLIERLNQARKGVGQIVLLSGEPGLGKTRMVQMICNRVDRESCLFLDCYGAPYYKNSFLYPVMDMVRRIIGLQDESDPQQQISLIEQTVATLGLDANAITPVLADLLSIPHPEGNNALVSSTPQQRKQQTFDALISLLNAVAHQRFILLVVEDLQWVDPSTIELLSLLVEQPGLTNIFALITFRSDFAPPWKSHASLTQVTLNRLTQKQSGSMIKQLCGQKMLPVEVFNEIINKTDGIPFFVEEFTNAVLRSSLLQEKDSHFELNHDMAQLGIPSTLQDSLMSRLDDLGEDKELAQLSATLGREFTYELLHAATLQNESSLRAGMGRLINAELFFQHGQPPKAMYRFQHALLREAAYQSLLKRTRQQYHERISTLIKERFPQVVADNPEILAHHYTEAGNPEAALQYWLAAGRYAMQRSANVEAVAHLSKGLALISELPVTPQLNMQELALQTNLGLAIMMSKGYAAPEAEQAYARAYHLCHSISDSKTVLPVLCGLWEFHIVRAELDEAQKISEEIQHIAEQSKTQEFLLEAKRVLGTTLFWQGHFSDALQNLEVHVDTKNSKTAPHSKLVAYSQDTQVASLANAACILWLLGDTEQALERGIAALDLAKRLAHPFSQAYALHFMGTLSQLCDDKDATYRYADAQIALSDTYGFSFWAATGHMLQAWAESPEQPADKVCERFQNALADYERSGNRLARSYFQALLADLLRTAGHHESACQTIESALRESAFTGEGFFTAELLRLRGELAAASDGQDITSAEQFLEEALEVARQQGAKALIQRCETSMAGINQSTVQHTH
ncbi:MAG TPA: adenylate/guanylate cyclase domain-containing protein [Gammaproteobacteria bacterium]|nr:adenylate/guanylate cyclase domain-containing protein [Gammaproteobacteria bacterium]